MSSTRYFKLVVDGEVLGGRYTGKGPKQAAKKAFTSYLKQRKSSKQSTQGRFNFGVVECTRGSNCNVYEYTGKRVKLAEPTVVTIGDREVTYNYANDVKRVQSGGAKRKAKKSKKSKKVAKRVRKSKKSGSKKSKRSKKSGSKKTTKRRRKASRSKASKKSKKSKKSKGFFSSSKKSPKKSSKRDIASSLLGIDIRYLISEE